jgi:hypothetical protein
MERTKRILESVLSKLQEMEKDLLRMQENNKEIDNLRRKMSKTNIDLQRLL